MKRSANQVHNGNTKKKRKVVGELLFMTVKSKLNTVIARGEDNKTNPTILEKIKSVAITAHETYKRALFFLKAYCLHKDDVPKISISTMRLCINQVCKKHGKGKKNKEQSLLDDMTQFWEDEFKKIYPEKLEGIGMSYILQLLADQMLTLLLRLLSRLGSRNCYLTY